MFEWFKRNSQNPTEIVLGKKLPWPEYSKPGDYAAVILNEKAFDVVISLKGLSEGEEYAIADDEFEIFIARSEFVPFMVFKFGNVFKCDLTINLKKMKPEFIGNWLRNDAKTVTIYLLEGRTARVKAIRFVPFEEMASLKEVCKCQLNHTKEEIDGHIRAIYSRWSVEQMMTKASIRFTVDEALVL